MKKMFLFTILFFLAFVNSAFAHTGLKSSSPQNGELINEELKQIILTFETKVEQGSTFELQKLNGETISVENISLSENQMVGNFPNSLENGEYQVNWKIIGADGHPIEGEFSFSIDKPVTEEPAEEQVEPQEETQPQTEVEEEKIETVNEATDDKNQQDKTPSYVIPTIIGVLIVIVVGSFLLIMKRKK
ncbi:copper resistance protein CopC [Mesobacillus maritimus]|uniref:copper resistance CopC family protein n=1 Tax=Mesobacillus maritimus TaxID=1643336 RepID=UPI00203FFD4D|nr:copper resistance protein CopC [Mesobacillus maritimus]MCM3668982.1 copper resistance protein CopC [Mesobacillus maritimus]